MDHEASTGLLWIVTVLGTGYPEKLWVPHPWRWSRSGWMHPKLPNPVGGNSVPGQGLELDF